MNRHDKKDWQQFKEENQADEQELSDESELSQEATHEEEAGLEHVSYAELSDKLTVAERLAHENWEKSVRALAELDNVRRRAEREISNAHRFGLEKLLTALLPVVDSLEQALQTAEKEDNMAMSEGLELTMKLFVDVLQKFDVQQIDPAGAVFDPQEHEAMSIQDIPGAEPNTIVTVFQKGYKLNGRVIRPARVIVSKK